MATKGKSTKYVYYFGGKQSEGKVTMKTILGGKGAPSDYLFLPGSR